MIKNTIKTTINLSKMSINLVHPSSKGYHDIKTTNSYVKGRPQIPLECIEFIKNNKLFNLNDNSKVLDLAAGTGKFTEQLAKVDFKDITAVEPSKEFRDSCSELLQSLKDNGGKSDLKFKVLDGISTSIPAADNEIDILFISQGYHWFSNVDTLKEVSRVLKPGGTLIMIWYDMDLSSDIVRKYADVVHEKWYDGLAPQFRSYKWKQSLVDFKPIFEQAGGKGLIDPNLQMEKFHFIQKANKQTCIERALSISYISTLPQEKKDQLIKEICQVLDNDDISSDNKTFDFPYKVELYYTQKK